MGAMRTIGEEGNGDSWVAPRLCPAVVDGARSWPGKGVSKRLGLWNQFVLSGSTIAWGLKEVSKIGATNAVNLTGKRGSDFGNQAHQGIDIEVGLGQYDPDRGEGHRGRGDNSSHSSAPLSTLFRHRAERKVRPRSARRADAKLARRWGCRV